MTASKNENEENENVTHQEQLRRENNHNSIVAEALPENSLLRSHLTYLNKYQKIDS
jgi:hypothetical protein